VWAIGLVDGRSTGHPAAVSDGECGRGRRKEKDMEKGKRRRRIKR